MATVFCRIVAMKIKSDKETRALRDSPGENSKTGKKINVPIDDFNHLMDAMRYAIEALIKGDAFSFD